MKAALDMPQALSNDTETITFINALLLYGVHAFNSLPPDVQFPPDQFTLTLNKIAHTSIRIWNSISRYWNFAFWAHPKGFSISYLSIQSPELWNSFWMNAKCHSYFAHKAFSSLVDCNALQSMRNGIFRRFFLCSKFNWLFFTLANGCLTWYYSTHLAQISRQESHRMHHLVICR